MAAAVVAGAALVLFGIHAVILCIAAKPVVTVSAAQTKSSREAAGVKDAIQKQYERLYDAVSTGHPGPLGEILTSDFALDRIWGDRVFTYGRQNWMNDVQRYGANRQKFAAAANQNGVRLQRKNKVDVHIEDIRLEGGKATVRAEIIFRYSSSRYPDKTNYNSERLTIENDTWVNVANQWKLRRVEVVRTKNSSESSRG